MALAMNVYQCHLAALSPDLIALEVSSSGRLCSRIPFAQPFFCFFGGFFFALFRFRGFRFAALRSGRWSVLGGVHGRVWRARFRRFECGFRLLPGRAPALCAAWRLRVAGCACAAALPCGLDAASCAVRHGESRERDTDRTALTSV